MALIQYDNPQSIVRGTTDSDRIEFELTSSFFVDAWGDTGNDVYVVDYDGWGGNGLQIHEDVGGGTDTVIFENVWSSFSLQLDDNVENLTLRDQEGSGSLYGNALNNQLIIDTGGGYNDYLDGGAGADTMAGGDGGDYYYVDNVGDRIVEAEDEGLDTVYSQVTHSLGANVENLYLQGEGAHINGTGNASQNYIYGNSGNNTISGLGGEDQLYGNDGNDNLQGGDGNDYIVGGEDNDVLAGGIFHGDRVFGRAGGRAREAGFQRQRLQRWRLHRLHYNIIGTHNSVCFALKWFNHQN
jgi:Ca2+-binding RTX toxin-like protein